MWKRSLGLGRVSDRCRTATQPLGRNLLTPPTPTYHRHLCLRPVHAQQFTQHAARSSR